MKSGRCGEGGRVTRREEEEKGIYVENEEEGSKDERNLRG